MKRRITKIPEKPQQKLLPFLELHIPLTMKYLHARGRQRLNLGEKPQLDETNNLFFMIGGIKFILPRKKFPDAYKKFCPA